MKVICTQENLRTGLSAVSRIITSSNTLPILNNVLLKTENGLLKISSTNLEISIHTLVRCKVEETGEVCVPAKIINDLVASLPNRNISLSYVNGVLKIDADKNTASVKTLPSEDFPSTPIVESSTPLVFDSPLLKNGLESVVFAASTSEVQPEISGVFIKPMKNGCVFVATDRYRLAEKKFVDSSLLIGRGIILPLKTVQEIIKTLSGSDQRVELLVGENQVMFTIGDTQLISRIIDGEYPDYEQIIPTNFATEAVINRVEFLGALKTSSIFSQGSNSIRVEIGGGTVLVKSGSQDFGESSAAVTADISGPPVSVLFNFRYVLDMLNNIHSERVILKLNSDSLPVVISEHGNVNYLYLVMPIKS